MSRRRWDTTQTLADAFKQLRTEYEATQPRADYDAAKTSRYRRSLTGVSAMGSGADYHYRSEVEFLRMIELARYYDRCDQVVGQGVTRLIDNVLQDGVKVDPQTGNAEADARLTALWRKWTTTPEQCHRPGEYKFHRMARLALRSVVVDGDILFLGIKDGTIEPIEAHRLRTPRTKRNVVHGILFDDDRRPLEYWLTKEDIEPYRNVSRVGEMKQYPARDAKGDRQVFHVRNPKRFSQARGVSAFMPIADPTGMFGDIQFAKLVQAQVASCFAIFRQRDFEMSAGDSPQRGEGTTETLADGTTRTIEGVAPGMEITGAPGEKLLGFSPNIPNPEYFPHAMLILTIISINLNLPLAVLLLDPSKTNFSGWRGAMDQAREGFRGIQGWMVDFFYEPIYLWKVRQFLAEDPVLAQLAMQDGVDIFAHRWNAPRWKYIEPLKDASADLLRERNAMTSKRRRHAEQGNDWEEVANEIVEDNALAIRLAKTTAIQLNTEFDDDAPVHWRELISLPTPDGVSIDLSAASEPGGGQQ